MERKKLVALALVLVLISAGTTAAVLMVLSNILNYDVTVEGTPIEIAEISGPSGTLSKGVNHTFHITATVNGGDWSPTYFVVNVSSNVLSDSTYLTNFIVYMNDTQCSNVHESSTPDVYQSHYPMGTLSEGDVLTIYWTIYFDFIWPSADYNIKVYMDGESI